ncbi:MAG: glycosyltransferase [Desulfovibrio sp.]|nr:glycosyltransferase [Desulfovibrio sp.]MBI4960595.1 glycosyltransferase [Desulfovibrio sp.]
MAPLISVLLPVRNAADCLPRALESLSAQSLADHEVLAVDDGSDDDGRTLTVLKDYALKDKRLKIIEAGRVGIANALNLAAGQACGKYLARMDADDESHPERFRLQGGYLDAHPEVDVLGCRVRFGGDHASASGYARHVEWVNGLVTHEEMALGVFRDAPLAHPSVMVRAQAFKRFGGYRQGEYPEDYELWLRWFESGARFAKLPGELLTWNDPPGRLSRSDSRYSPDSFHGLKSAFLARWLEANNAHHPDVVVVGAGRVTRRRAEWLCVHGVRITAYLDIDPKKIGRIHKGRPVLHHRHAPVPGKGFVVSYVSTPGAAQHVAEYLTGLGYLPGKDYIQAG